MNWTHILPRNDLREHEESETCWCKPDIDEEDGLIIHNALDGREKIETGEARIN